MNPPLFGRFSCPTCAGHDLDCTVCRGTGILPERGTGRPVAYRDAAGKRVPSVTTITGRFKDSGGLIAWAHKQGMDGVSLDDARQPAMDAGSLVHSMVEASVHGGDVEEVLRLGLPYGPNGPDVEFEAKVRAAFGAYSAWAGSEILRVVATEVPLVHSTLGYGGTLDGMALDHAGRLVVLDWKTSNSVYVDMLAQLAAYRELWRDQRGDEVDGAHLLRFSKGGSFHHHFYPDLTAPWRYFRSILDAYGAERACREIL